MNLNELRQEINFGLENLENIYQSISEFSKQEIEERVKISALTYECLGYYNAIEHLIIRILKYMKIKISSGPFSHRDTLKAFLLLTVTIQLFRCVRKGKMEKEENFRKNFLNLSLHFRKLPLFSFLQM